jgi:hypothetical protein
MRAKYSVITISFNLLPINKYNNYSNNHKRVSHELLQEIFYYHRCMRLV